MTNGIDYEYDLFISYNRADEEWAEQLATRLEKELWQAKRLKVFFAPWDILPGESIDARLEHALTRSRKVGLIMTPESVASEWVNEERYTTQHIDIARRERRLVPLYRRTCDVPPFLEHIKHIDFRDDDKFEEGYKLLLAAIKGERPARGEQEPSASTATLPLGGHHSPVVDFEPRLRSKLMQLRQLEEEELIDESVSKEYQRRLLDKWIDTE
jgi:hypothetical protein